MTQPDPNENWKDPAEEGATFAPVTVDASDLNDYVRWAGEDRGWRKLLAAINGGAALGTQDGRELADTRVSPASLMEAGAAFHRTYDTLSWLETFVRDHSRAVAGPDRAWQGPAADAFIRKMDFFAEWLGNQADRISGGSAGANSIPNQLYHDGNTLAWAQLAMNSIDTQYAALSFAQDPARKGPDGNIAISGTSLEKPMATQMRDVVGKVADEYQLTYDKVTVPTEAVVPVTGPTPPPTSSLTPPNFTTPPLTTPPNITPPTFTTPPPKPTPSVTPAVTVPPPKPTPSVTPAVTPKMPDPPNLTPPPVPGDGIPSVTPPPPPTFSGPPIGAGGGVPNFSLPPVPGGGGVSGGGLPGFDVKSPGGGAGGGSVFNPPQIPSLPHNSGNVGGGANSGSNADALAPPVIPPAFGAGGGLDGGVTVPSLPAGTSLPAGGGAGLGVPGGGMPFPPGGAPGGGGLGGGAGVPESPDANGLLGGDQEDWRPAGVESVDVPQGGALPGGAGLEGAALKVPGDAGPGVPAGFPGGGMPFPPGAAGGGAPGGPGAAIPDAPDAKGLVIGDAGDWKPSGAGGNGNPDAPYGISAGGIGLDASPPRRSIEPVPPESSDRALPGVEAVAGGELDGTDLVDELPPLPVAPLAGSAYGISVPGIGPDVPHRDVPQPFAVGAVMPGQPPADDPEEREEPERPASAELLEEEAETWAVGPPGGEVPPGDDHVPVVRPSDGDDDTAGWDDVADSWWLMDDNERRDDEERDHERKLTDA